MVIDKRKHLRTTPIIVGGIFDDNLPKRKKRYNLNTQKDKSKSYEEKNNFNINNTVG